MGKMSLQEMRTKGLWEAWQPARKAMKERDDIRRKLAFHKKKVRKLAQENFKISRNAEHLTREFDKVMV